MKEVIVDTLSNGEYTFKAPILYYESIEEGDAVGGPGSMLREANLNLDYRGARQDVRDILVEVVEELTKVERKKVDTGEKDDKGQSIFEVDPKETDGKYITRALTESGVSNETIQAELTRRCQGYRADDGSEVPPVAVDVRKRERKAPKPRKLSQEARDTATKLIAGPNMDKLFAKFASVGFNGQDHLGRTFTPTGDNAKDVESLGWVLQAYSAFLTAKAKAETAALAA